MGHILKVRGRIRRSRVVQGRRGTDVALDPGRDASVRGKGRSSIPIVLSVTLMKARLCITEGFIGGRLSSWRITSRVAACSSMDSTYRRIVAIQ